MWQRPWECFPNAIALVLCLFPPGLFTGLCPGNKQMWARGEQMPANSSSEVTRVVSHGCHGDNIFTPPVNLGGCCQLVWGRRKHLISNVLQRNGVLFFCFFFICALSFLWTSYYAYGFPRTQTHKSSLLGGHFHSPSCSVWAKHALNKCALNVMEGRRRHEYIYHMWWAIKTYDRTDGSTDWGIKGSSFWLCKRLHMWNIVHVRK